MPTEKKRNEAVLSHDAADSIDPSEKNGFFGARLSATVILLRNSAEGIEVWVQELSLIHISEPTRRTQ